MVRADGNPILAFREATSNVSLSLALAIESLVKFHRGTRDGVGLSVRARTAFAIIPVNDFAVGIMVAQEIAEWQMPSHRHGRVMDVLAAPARGSETPNGRCCRDPSDGKRAAYEGVRSRFRIVALGGCLGGWRSTDSHEQEVRGSFCAKDGCNHGVRDGKRVPFGAGCFVLHVGLLARPRWPFYEHERTTEVRGRNHRDEQNSARSHGVSIHHPHGLVPVGRLGAAYSGRRAGVDLP
jgi:hypothetical protein